MIRLYGVEKGNSSWPRVTAGIRHGLKAHDQLAGFFDVVQVNRYGYDASEEGHKAKVGLCIGPPTSASVMTGRGEHKHRLLIIATNSNWLPEKIMERAAEICTGFIGTSRWASSVIERYACGLSVYTWLHGVDGAFKPLQPGESIRRPGIGLRVLHLASTHFQRKGTRELIFAWAMAYRENLLGQDPTLRLVVDGPDGYFWAAIEEATGGDSRIIKTYHLMTRLDLHVAAMRKLYLMHDLVIQPSRGEGFGLVPLEARACGVPVAMTLCTGHADHGMASESVIAIAHGADALIDDGPGAMAPTVTPEAIFASLKLFCKNKATFKAAALQAAGDVGQKWSWTTVTAEFLDHYGQELR